VRTHEDDTTVPYKAKSLEASCFIANMELQEGHTVKDLGVTFDEQLKFSDHCYDKIKKAYSVLGLIKRNFSLLCRDSFVMLYKSMARSHLEYANAVWNPHREGLIKDLERVQMTATKLVSELKKKCFKERLTAVKLPTLKYRRIRGDMTELYKLLTNTYCTYCSCPLAPRKSFDILALYKSDYYYYYYYYDNTVQLV